MATADLFDTLPDLYPQEQRLADGAVLLRGFARNVDIALINALAAVIACR